MPVNLVTPFVLDVRLKEKIPIGGHVVVYFFQEDNVHRVLAPMVEEISRRCPLSVFLKVDGDGCSEDMLVNYQVSVFPTLLVYKFGQVKAKLEVSTREGLVAAMKREGVLKDTEEITNVITYNQQSMASGTFNECYELDEFGSLIGFGKRLEGKLKKDREIGGSVLKAGTKVVVHLIEKRNLTPKQSKAIHSSFDTLRKLKNHPNVKHLIEVLEDDKVITVVKEHVGGVPLTDVIDLSGPFSEKEAAMQQIMSVIDTMNKQGLTHRGLTVDGILYTEDKEAGTSSVKLSEFQTSGPISDSLDSGVFLLTANAPPHCVAPEVLSADVPFTEKVDWWSIGVITYTLLFGSYPFDDPNDAVVIQNILAAKYSFPDDDTVSAEAKDFVTKLLQEDVSARAAAAECWAHPWIRY